MDNFEPQEALFQSSQTQNYVSQTRIFNMELIL